MTSARKSLNYVEAMDIRAMVRDTIKTNKDLDRCVDGSNTLLHLAIQNNLVDCVVKLLSSGADANLLNEDGYTARDLALENGNQILLQVLSRREEYTVHLRLFDRSADISSSTSGMDSFNILASLDPDIIATDAKMVPLLIGTIYEDYMDWTDSQRCNHLQHLVDTLRTEEVELKRHIEGLNTRRICNNNKLQELHCTLRDREHALCLDVWSTIQAERQSRRQLERASSEVVKVKTLLTNALEHIHYQGIVRVAPYKRVFFNSWHHNTVEITGSMLIIHAQTEDSNRTKSNSISQKYHSTTGSDIGGGCGGSESEGADVDTDGSNTAAGYSTEAVLAAHALGKDGLHHTTTTTTTTTTTNSHIDHHTSLNSTNWGDTQSTSPCHSYSRPFLSYSTGPVRRKLQKMHEFHTKQRKINVQDIIAVEICKEDKSLGAAYVQIELRIHYRKGGSQKRNIQNLLTSPLPAVHRDTGNDTISRERLLSVTSNCSGSSSVAESIRSNSAESVSATAATLVSTIQHTLAATVSRSTPILQKQRSTSTGGKAGSSGVLPMSVFDFSPLGNNSNSSSNSNIHHAVSSSESAATVGPPSTGSLTPSTQCGTEKVETVWFKLPLQTNTTTRAAATGKKRRALAADDGSGGQILTFELFIATLKRIKEGVRVYTVSHGVETAYRVNKVLGEPSPSISLKGVSLLGTPNRSAKSGTAHSPSSTFASPSGSNKLKKNASSGNLCEMSESSLNTAVVVPLRLPISLNSPESKSSSRNIMIPCPTRTISTTSSTSSRTDSSSTSPKYNANTATFSSRLSSSSHSHTWGMGYHNSGSMNSASGLTSIESLVGIASMRGGTRTGSMSAGSASYNTTTTTSTSTSSLSLKNWSPRYENKFPMDGTLFEETPADIEEMEEETDISYPDYTRQQSYMNTDDEATVSADEHSHQFLPLTRRHTEGNEELLHNNLRRNQHHLTTSAPIYLDGNSSGLNRPGELVVLSEVDMHSAAVYVGEGCEEQQKEGEIHTTSSSTATTTSAVECSVAPPLCSDMSINTDEAALFEHREAFCEIQQRQTVAATRSPGLSCQKDNTLAPLSGRTIEFTGLIAPPIPVLQRTGSNHSAHSHSSSKSELHRSFDGGSPRTPRSAKTITATTTITTTTTSSTTYNIKEATSHLQRMRIDGSGPNDSLLSQSAEEGDQVLEEYLLRHPVKLTKMLEKARNKRNKIELKLVELLTSREKMRECIQYLQSLRAIVDAPPVAPTRSLAKTKAPSIDKAMLLLQVYGDHINLITEGLPPTTSASKHGGRLGDAEEFVRIMLQVNGPTPHTPMPSSSVCDSQLYSSNYCERDSFTSTAGRGSFTTVHRSSSGPSPLVRKLFTDDMFTRPPTTTTTTSSSCSAMRPSLEAWTTATEHNINNNNCSSSTPQLLRSPPPGFKADFDAVMTHLEEIWNCELDSFQHVERLAQCLTQRAQTWQRLKELREQEESMSLPTAEDLYEIAF